MYAEALEQREEQSPTGLATIPYGIASPHTDPEYVIAPCIVVIRASSLWFPSILLRPCCTYCQRKRL